LLFPVFISIAHFSQNGQSFFDFLADGSPIPHMRWSTWLAIAHFSQNGNDIFIFLADGQKNPRKDGRLGWPLLIFRKMAMTFSFF